MDKYNTLLSSITTLFNVNDVLRDELNSIALEQHNLTLDELLKQWAVSNATLNNDAYIELIDYLNMLNSDPHCISDMQELYDFIYDFGG